MVFESIVADILNRFGGQYIENLDHSQLKIGIWGGDIVLKDLNLKPTLLEDLDLPIRASFGHIGKFVLKIPWTNIYNAPVIANVEKVYIVVVPKTQIVYNAEKEEKQMQEAKLAALLQIDEAKKREREKDKPKEPDTFVEKLVTQIIKNVQLKISEIHIRYEDNFSQPQKPFSLGITLHDISVHSTDENWKRTAVPDAALKMIYKVLELKGFSLYWNCRSELFSRSNPEKVKQKLAESTTKYNPKNQYILAPINLKTQLRINPKPENDGTDFSTPKILLGIILQKLSLGMSKSQYQDIIVLAENIGAMTRASAYRKYRPNVPVHGHIKEWWKFAYTCVLENDVRRRHLNWSWNHMKKHRNLCRKYAKAFRAKIESRKVSAQVATVLSECEKQLDVFNLVLVRQSVELEMERLSKTADQRGWFSGWFGGSTQKSEDPLSTAALMKKFESAMTSEEKQKLYQAIGYQESSLPTQYPITFIENIIDFELQGLSVEIMDDTYDVPRVLYGELSKVIVHFEQRPAADAVKLVATVGSFGVWGLKQGNIIPHIVSFKTLDSGTKLLDVLFETNPTDKSCDQRLQISSRPLEIVYDAMSINKLVDVFKTPQTRTMAQLQAVAESRLSDFKDVSALGMRHAIETHAVFDINVDLSASYIIIPHSGLFDREKDQDLLLVNLGQLSMVSMNQDRSTIPTVKDLHEEGLGDEEILAFMSSKSYDKFRIRLTDVQVLMALGGEDWEGTLATHERCAMHLLEPMSLEVLLQICLVSDNIRLPQSRMEAVLPAIAMNLEDERMIHLLALLSSIIIAGYQVEEEKTELIESKMDTLSHTSSMTMDLNRLMDKSGERKNAHKKKSVLQQQKTEDIVQTIVFQMEFVIKDLSIALFRKHQLESLDSELFLDFKLLRLVFKLEQKTYDLTINVNMGSLEVNFYDVEKQIGMVSTPMKEGEDKYMFLLKFIRVSNTSPEFHSLHGSVVQLLEIDVTSLTVLLHQEALLALWEYFHILKDSIDSIQFSPAKKTASRIGPAASQKAANLRTIQEEGAKTKKVSKKRGNRYVTEAIDFKLLVKLFTFKVEMLNRKCSIARFTLDGGSVDVIMKKSYTEVFIKLRNVSLFDPSPLSNHRQIMSVMGEEALFLRVVIFNVDMFENNPDAVDVALNIRTSAIRIFFLNCFFSRILNFINPFQMMQQMIESAAKEAAETAMQNVQEAYANATRLSIDINLQAPVIIIPANSLSFDALYFDMGTLIVKNSFHFLPLEKESEESPVIDEITVDLQDMKLLRVLLTFEEKIESESILLQPLSFKLLIQRNLSSSWYTTAPDVELSGRLGTVKLTISDDDYYTISRIFNENLQEVEVITPAPAPDIKPSVGSSITTERNLRPSKLEAIASIAYKSDKVEPPIRVKPQQGPVTTKVKFTFTMDNLVVDLYITAENEQKGVEQTHLEFEKNLGLARFSLNFISIKGHVYSDGTISTSLLLVNCLLDDTRVATKSKIRRLMQRKRDVSQREAVAPHSEPVDSFEQSFKSMVDVTFQKKGSDTFVDVRVFGFDLVLSTEFLMRIGDFFAGWTYREKLNQQLEASRPVTPSVKSSKPSVTKSFTSSKPSSISPPPSENSGMFTMNVRVEKPDIIMVESVEDINTRAIVLNKELTLKMRISEDHQVICGSIKDLELYTCVFNPKRRLESTYQILRPCCISIAGSTPSGEGLHLDVCITPIRLSVSPAIIELLSNVQKGLVIPEIKRDVNREKNIDYSNLWQPKPFFEEEHWFLKRDDAQEADEAAPSVEEIEPTEKNVRGELCIVSVSSVVMTVEAGVGSQTSPMLLMDMSFNGAINNWSSQLFIDSCVSLEVKYYNSALALWEPLLEPVEVQHETGLVSHVPWELRFQMRMNSAETPPVSSPTSETGEVEELQVQPALMDIEISSKENLEITVTKTCMDVLSNLAKSFQTALKGTLRRTEPVAPFTIKNDTGLAIAVLLENSPFRVLSSDGESNNYKEVMLESGARVELCLADPDNEDVWNLGLQKNITGSSDTPFEQYLKVKVIERNCNLSLPVRRADKRYFSLKHRGEGNEPWGLVSCVIVKDGGTRITLRSIIQVHNHFNVPINVYYMTKRGNEVECIGTVEHKEKLNIPLYAVYTPTNELFFSVEGYTVSVVPFVWKNLQNLLSSTEVLQCDPKTKNDAKDPFMIKIVGEMEQVFYENTTRHTMMSTCYNLHLRPTVVLKNNLPVQVVVCLTNTLVESKLGTGQRLQLPTAEPGKSSVIIRIPEYLEKEWSCDYEIELNPPELAVWTFGTYDSMQKTSLDLGMRTVCENGSTVMTLYCPYWMLNKTGLLLSYRKSRKSVQETSGSPIKQVDDSANILYHPEHFKGPVMFSFKAKSFFGKKKACIKVEDSDWSDKFPLDVAGSSGLVQCKNSDLIYKIGVYIQLTYSSLTKQVVFTPYYLLLNSSKFSIEVQEAHRPADPWITVDQIGCTPFWPKCEEPKELRARIAGSNEMTPAFAYDKVYTILLRLDNKYGGINVDVQMTEGSAYIRFMAYEPGLAPAFIMNNLDVPVSYHEQDEPITRFLEPQTSVMFSWLNPVGTKTLIWGNLKKKNVSDDLRKIEINQLETRSEIDNPVIDAEDDDVGEEEPDDGTMTPSHASRASLKDKKKSSHKDISKDVVQMPVERTRGITYHSWWVRRASELRKDGIGEFMPAPERRAYWVSFLDGMQRVLLFTYDLQLAKDAQAAGEMERIDKSITLSIHGVGVSLVNNIVGLECLYCCLASSGVVWEVCKHNHKRYKPLIIEDNKVVEEAFVAYQQSLVLGEVLEVQTLENGMEVDFEKGELLKPNKRLLRRTYNTGLWIQLKTSKHQMQFHAKVNRLQVDNQMPDCLFPVVVAPVPLPRSISAKEAFKPFIEMSVVKRLLEHSPVVQYKYFKVLVQEFHIKVDVGFVNALIQFFQAEVTDEDEQMRFEEDCKLATEPLWAHVALISSAEQKNFYDLLHLSPLKIHLSFSLSSSSSGLQSVGQEAPHVLNVLMQSLGVTLTEMQDVILKLAYFDRQYVFLTQRQLISEVSSHYLGQLLQQLYVLVLGLDVLGNPYGLVLGVARGFEDLFYEPFQGAIQGPGEFAEGLVLGVRSLFGHTVGGAAGAMSRIAGAMGKGVAALTFDKEYQRKRREQIVQRPANIHTGLARSGKGLVMGVVAGVSGVFTKPVSGARQEGVEGFFKGVGKGVVGLVTRPTAGIIDFASGTLDSVKRAADPNEEVTRLRPPRFTHPDGQIRPYVLYEAQGNKLLMQLEKGRYSSTDVYSFHLGIVSGAKDVLLLTDKRVMYVVHNDVFGGWQVDWEYTWESLAAPPAIVDKGIFITTKEPRKKILGIFNTTDKGGKIILVDDADQREWLVKKMNEIMKY